MNPILMVVSSFRYGVLGVEVGPLYLHLTGLAVCAVGLVLVLMVMIERRYRLGD
jgi:ABC-type polysaccharide/polyol phosphate export permease